MALDVGSAKGLTASVLPVGAPQAVVWSSSDDSVAKVSASGSVSGLKAGTADITASTPNGISASCKVTVKAAPPPPLTGIKLDKHTKLVRVGQQGIGLEASPIPENAAFEGLVTWTSSSDGRIAVAADGTFDIKAAGNVTITATYGGFTDTCDVTVMVAGPGDPVTGIEELDYLVGLGTQGQTLKSPVQPKGAEDLRVEWKIEDPNGVLMEPIPVNTRDMFRFVRRYDGPTEIAGVVKLFAKPLGKPELGFLPAGKITVKGTKVE